MELTLRRFRMFTAACGFAGAVALTATMSAPLAVADESPAGSAYALSVRTTLLNAPLVKIDPLPTAAYPKGADESIAKVGPNLAGLVSAKVLSASSDVKSGSLTSVASLADVVVRDILSAKVVTAECQASKKGLTGKSSIAELTVLGQKIDVNATADIDVLGVATVKINEQVRHGNTLTVNAVHVTVGGPVRGITSADVVLSQAKCSGTAGGPETPPTSTTTTQPSESEGPAPTTGTSEPDHPATTTSGSAGDAQGDVTPVADSGDLAETGVSAIIPIAIGGLLLLMGGAAAIYYTRRSRTAASSPSED
jgi:hypothetical protein